MKKDVLINFTKFTGKHQCFAVNFGKFLIAPLFTEHLWTTASLIGNLTYFSWYALFGHNLLV